MKRQPLDESVTSKLKVWLIEECQEPQLVTPRGDVVPNGVMYIWWNLEGFCSGNVWNIDLKV